MLKPFAKAIVQTPAGSVLLREANVRDAKQLNAIFNSPGVNEFLLYPPSSVRKTIESIVSEKKRGEKSVVAVLGGKVVGRISVRPHAGRAGHVSSFGVMFDKSVHGKGIASAAFEKFFEYLRENGFELIQAEVIEGNARARGFYEKMGFEELCTVPGAFKRDGKKWGSVVMVKKL